MKTIVFEVSFDEYRSQGLEQLETLLNEGWEVLRADSVSGSMSQGGGNYSKLHSMPSKIIYILTNKTQ